MKRLISVFLILTFSLALFSCGDKKNIPEEKIEIPNIEIAKHWTNENGVVCIVFGYGFNEPAYYNPTVEKLSSIYGLNQDGGLLWPMVYPDDFKNGIRGLHKTLEGTKVKGILFLGAPNETHLVLARYQDEFGGNTPFTVISLFPQDDILGQESTCSLILDYEQSTSPDEEETESSRIIGAEAEQIFINSVKFLANSNGVLEIDPELKKVAQKIAGLEKNVRPYVDRGSSMQSLNHFIVESK